MKIRPAEPAEFTIVADNLARTFAADPSVGWILRKSRDPIRLLSDFFRIITTDVAAIGHIDTVWDDGEYLGAAVWMPPTTMLPRRALLRALPLLRQVGSAWPMLARYGLAASSVKLPFPAWHLSVIAVGENVRGRGVGSALLDAGLTRVGAEAARLEATSERSAKLYQSRGFIRLGEVPSPAPVPEIIMWRPAGRP